jgi:hypothetical protein
MAIIALDHVQTAIPIGRENDARQFYIGLLGFEEIPKPLEMAKRGGLWLKSGSVSLHIGVEADFIPAKKAHIALIIDEYDKILELLAAHGLPVKINIEIDGINRAFTEDCFGNRIELIDYHSPLHHK